MLLHEKHLSTQITALRAFRNIVIVGEGQQLSAYRLSSNELLSCTKVFTKVSVHGIKILPDQVPVIAEGSQNDAQATVLVWGQRSFSLLALNTVTGACWIILAEQVAEDWIVAGEWLHSSHPSSSLQQSANHQSCLHDFVLLTAHSALLRYSPKGDATTVPKRCDHPPPALYQLLEDSEINETEGENPLDHSKATLVARVQCAEKCILFSGCIIIPDLATNVNSNASDAVACLTIDNDTKANDTGPCLTCDSSENTTSMTNVVSTDIVGRTANGSSDVIKISNDASVSNATNVNNPTVTSNNATTAAISTEANNSTRNSKSNNDKGDYHGIEGPLWRPSQCHQWDDCVCIGGTVFGGLLVWGLHEAANGLLKHGESWTDEKQGSDGQQCLNSQYLRKEARAPKEDGTRGHHCQESQPRQNTEMEVQPCHQLQAHKGVVFSVSWCPALGLLTTTSDDRSVNIWTVTSAAASIPNVSFEATCDIVPNGNESLDVIVESDGASNSALVGSWWSSCSITLHRSCLGHQARVWRSCIINRSSNYVGGMGSTTNLITSRPNAEGMKRMSTELLTSRNKSEDRSARKANDNILVSVGEDSNICVFALNGDLLKSWRGHEGASIWCQEVCYDNCCPILLTGGGDGAVKKWHLNKFLEDKYTKSQVQNKNLCLPWLDVSQVKQNKKHKSSVKRKPIKKSNELKVNKKIEDCDLNGMLSCNEYKDVAKLCATAHVDVKQTENINLVDKQFKSGINQDPTTPSRTEGGSAVNSNVGATFVRCLGLLGGDKCIVCLDNGEVWLWRLSEDHTSGNYSVDNNDDQSLKTEKKNNAVASNSTVINDAAQHESRCDMSNVCPLKNTSGNDCKMRSNGTGDMINVNNLSDSTLCETTPSTNRGDDSDNTNVDDISSPHVKNCILHSTFNKQESFKLNHDSLNSEKMYANDVYPEKYSAGDATKAMDKNSRRETSAVEESSEWQLVLRAPEKLKGYSIVAVAPYTDGGSDEGRLVAVAGLHGDVFILKEDRKGVSCRPSQQQVAGKIFSASWVTNTRLLLCYAGGLLVLYQYQHSQARLVTVSSHALPPARQRWFTAASSITVTGAHCGDGDTAPQTVLLVGDRGGSLYLYWGQSGEPCSTVRSAHSSGGVVSMQHWGAGTGATVVLTTGRDGWLRYWRAQYRHSTAAGDKLNRLSLRSVYSSRHTGAGSWVARCLLAPSQHTLVCAFHHVFLEVWSTACSAPIARVECGGGHRAWDVAIATSTTQSSHDNKQPSLHKPKQSSLGAGGEMGNCLENNIDKSCCSSTSKSGGRLEASDSLTCVFLKEGLPCYARVPLFDNMLPLKPSLSIKTSLCAAELHSTKHGSVIAVTGEDNSVRLHLVTADGQLKQLAIINSHISAVRAVAVIRPHDAAIIKHGNSVNNCLENGCTPDHVWFVTAGGRAQMKIWRGSRRNFDDIIEKRTSGNNNVIHNEEKENHSLHNCEENYTIQNGEKVNVVSKADVDGSATKADSSNNSRLCSPEDDGANVVECAEVLSHQLMEDKPTSWRLQQEQIEAETRHMACSAAWLDSSEALIAVASSDALLRVFRLNHAEHGTKQQHQDDATSTALSAVCQYSWTHCLLTVDLQLLWQPTQACSEDTSSLMVAVVRATDTAGRLLYFTIKRSNKETGRNESHILHLVSQYQLHQSGINATASSPCDGQFATSKSRQNSSRAGHCNEEDNSGHASKEIPCKSDTGLCESETKPTEQLLLTGGDDNKIVLSRVRFGTNTKEGVCLSGGGKNIEVPTIDVTRLTDAVGHSSQVTGLAWLTATTFLSTSIDQRLIIWRVVEISNKGGREMSLVQDKSVFAGVPDVHGLILTNKRNLSQQTDRRNSTEPPEKNINVQNRNVPIYSVRSQQTDVTKSEEITHIAIKNRTTKSVKACSEEKTNYIESFQRYQSWNRFRSAQVLLYGAGCEMWNIVNE